VAGRGRSEESTERASVAVGDQIARRVERVGGLTTDVDAVAVAVGGSRCGVRAAVVDEVHAEFVLLLAGGNEVVEAVNLERTGAGANRGLLAEVSRAGQTDTRDRAARGDVAQFDFLKLVVDVGVGDGGAAALNEG